MAQSARGVVAIYCSGGIKKGAADTDKLVWSEIERRAIAEAIAPAEAVFLNPDDRTDDLNDAFTVFGRDHYQVKLSDVVVVDARQRRGIGVGIEMLSAKRFGKPVISVAPPDSHYRRARLEYLGGAVENYVHAHLFGLSDEIVATFSEAGMWIHQFLRGDAEAKGISVVDQAIEAYRDRQLAYDRPMQEVIGRLPVND